MIHFEIPKNQSSIIKVIGVGGGGGNAVNYMHNLDIEGVDFIVCNTDSQALALSPDGRRLFIGGLEGEIHCFDGFSWEEVHVLSVGARVQLHRLVCSPDGKTLAALTKTGVLYLVRTE